MAILRGCSHMRSTKFWDFFYPLPPCHCPIHPSYQYCCHVLGCPLLPSVYMDVICERPLSQGSSVSQTRLSGDMAVGGLRWKGRKRSLGGLRSRFRGFARKRGGNICKFHGLHLSSHSAYLLSAMTNVSTERGQSCTWGQGKTTKESL